MEKYIGEVHNYIKQNSTYDASVWSDYQVLGPMFSALRIFMTMDDVLVIVIGNKGCAYHLNFTLIAWGEIDFNLGKRLLPVIEYDEQQIVLGNFDVDEDWLKKLKIFTDQLEYKRIVLLPTDSLIICGANLEPIAQQIQNTTEIETTYLSISGISSANQWAGYDAALEALYRPLLNKKHEKTNSVNLVGWMWPSRNRGHEIGCCIDMLNEMGIEVNTVVSGGSTLEDIEKSMQAKCNAVVCSALMGNMLYELDKNGIILAGKRAPYGFSGTREWLENIANALNINIKRKIDLLEARYIAKFIENKEIIKGKKLFVSGGPGRLIGLLHTLIDYEADIQVAAMFWQHKWSKSDIKHMIEKHDLNVKQFILSPGLDDLAKIADEYDIDVWLGGYQEKHICKRNNIPFVPITVYTVPHVGYEGTVNLGNKLIMALNGHNFTENNFTANDLEGYICPKTD